MGPAVFFYALTSYQDLPSMPLTICIPKQIKYLLFLNVIRTLLYGKNQTLKVNTFRKSQKF